MEQNYFTKKQTVLVAITTIIVAVASINLQQLFIGLPQHNPYGNTGAPFPQSASPVAGGQQSASTPKITVSFSGAPFNATVTELGDAFIMVRITVKAGAPPSEPIKVLIEKDTKIVERTPKPPSEIQKLMSEYAKAVKVNPKTAKYPITYISEKVITLSDLKKDDRVNVFRKDKLDERGIVADTIARVIIPAPPQ